MAEVKVISVNPSTQTLGAINTAKLENLARSLRMDEASVSLPGLQAICRFVFGIDPTSDNPEASKPAFIRIVTSAFLALSAITASASFGAGLPFLIIAFVISGMMAIGFFERIASFVGFAMISGLTVYSVIGSSNPEAMMADPQTILFVFMACGLLVSCVMGPGSVSIDKIMSRAVYSTIKASVAERREKRAIRQAEIRLSYKAWRNSR